MPSDRPPLTQARLKELLHYDPETGVFTWRVSRGGIAAGSRAGTPDKEGYDRIKADGRKYGSHRLAFLYMTGSPPPDEVDHINREKGDNRWSNLRLATSRDNRGNEGLRRNNTSGYRGVTWDRQCRKWRAQGGHCGRTIHLGRFDTLEAAAEAARKWREKTFKEFACASPAVLYSPAL